MKLKPAILVLVLGLSIAASASAYAGNNRDNGRSAENSSSDCSDGGGEHGNGVWGDRMGNG